MRLTRLNIKNFRTIEELTINFPTHYSAICGKNDSGKNRLKELILQEFKKIASPGEEHYKGLYALAKQVDKALA
jgi:predicted ATP-dependent endonuclease of OLD family